MKAKKTRIQRGCPYCPTFATWWYCNWTRQTCWLIFITTTEDCQFFAVFNSAWCYPI